MKMALHYKFFLAGIIFVLLGMILGMWMGMHEDFLYKDVHAHLNLLGFVTNFIYGLYYRGDREAENMPLPKVQFWCAILGMIIIVPGIWEAQTQGPLAWLTIPGSLLSFLAMILFLVVVIQRSRSVTAA
jgi:cbb3-type cytochrome oxidase subunit 1